MEVSIRIFFISNLHKTIFHHLFIALAIQTNLNFFHLLFSKNLVFPINLCLSTSYNNKEFLKEIKTSSNEWDLPNRYNP
jgi:hypothetical protein